VERLRLYLAERSKEQSILEGKGLVDEIFAARVAAFKEMEVILNEVPITNTECSIEQEECES